MNKCGMCGKETNYESEVCKWWILTDCDTNEKIEYICKECENIVNSHLKKYLFERYKK